MRAGLDKVIVVERYLAADFDGSARAPVCEVRAFAEGFELGIPVLALGYEVGVPAVGIHPRYVEAESRAVGFTGRREGIVHDSDMQCRRSLTSKNRGL